MDKNEIKKFIFESGKATYASGDESIKRKETDGSTTIEYANGIYRIHDNYFGGEPYGGREVIFLNDKAIWMMVYYGFVHDGVNKDVYEFLMESLRNATVDMPYRGPAVFEREDWKYENNLTGEVERFSGTEKISRNNVCVYEASYLGGFVDL